jgi:hypothetical protein
LALLNLEAVTIDLSGECLVKRLSMSAFLVLFSLNAIAVSDSSFVGIWELKECIQGHSDAPNLILIENDGDYLKASYDRGGKYTLQFTTRSEETIKKSTPDNLDVKLSSRVDRDTNNLSVSSIVEVTELLTEKTIFFGSELKNLNLFNAFNGEIQLTLIQSQMGMNKYSGFKNYFFNCSYEKKRSRD